MYEVKVVNRADENDIVLVKDYEESEAIEANKFYQLYASGMKADKDAVIRVADETLHQSELRYCDVVLLLTHNGDVVKKFMIG